MLGSVLYLLYTANVPVAISITIATYANDIALLAAHNNHIASIPAFTTELLLHSEVAKEMENQN